MDDEVPEDMILEMKEHFGEEGTENYITLVKATRSLIYIWQIYVDAPSGSHAEAVVGQELERMTDGLRERPEHAVGIVQSLLAIIAHLRAGGEYEEWFTSMGIAPIPQQ